MDKAKKEVAGKPDLSLIPYCVEVELSRAMMYGAGVYGRYNYVKGHKACDLISAAKRHLGKLLSGEDFDADSGVHHMGHVMANCLMLLHQREVGSLIDDRPIIERSTQIRETVPQQTARSEPVPDLGFAPEVPTPVNNGAPEEDFGMPPPNKKKLKDTKWYLAARFPNGDERVSTDCYSTQAGAVAVLEEYIKQFPNCTFVAFQGKSYEPTK